MESQPKLARAVSILVSFAVIFTVLAVTFNPSLNKAFTCYYNTFFTYSVSDNFDIEGNPFEVGQRIYPVDDFCTADPMSNDASNASAGVTVLDISSEHVRVQFDNGEVHIYSVAWFKQPAVVFDWYYGDWQVGNPFSIGQPVCAVPDSVRESFPDVGVITGIDGDLLYIEGYDSPINFGHFQECVVGWNDMLRGQVAMAMIPNPFVVGDEVCVRPESTFETLPPRTTVVEVVANFIYVDGHDNALYHLLYEKCE